MSLLKEFFGSFSGIMKQYLSAKYFPNVDDTRLITHYGYIIDLNHLDFTFCNRNARIFLMNKSEFSYNFYN